MDGRHVNGATHSAVTPALKGSTRDGDNIVDAIVGVPPPGEIQYQQRLSATKQK